MPRFNSFFSTLSTITPLDVNGFEVPRCPHALFKTVFILMSSWGTWLWVVEFLVNSPFLSVTAAPHTFPFLRKEHLQAPVYVWMYDKRRFRIPNKSCYQNKYFIFKQTKKIINNIFRC